MRYGVVLFTSDRGITPASGAQGLKAMASTASMCLSTPTSRSVATPCIPGLGPQSCPTTGICARSTRGCR